MFDRFSAATTVGPTGTGLGLWISRRLAEAHGGSLTATSMEGEGSVFRLTLPLGFDPTGDDHELAAGRAIRHCSQTMIDEITRLTEDARRGAATASDLDELRALETELLGKQGRGQRLKSAARRARADERKQVGQALQRGAADRESVLAERRAELAAAARAASLAAERLDLTEIRGRTRAAISTSSPR